MSKVLVSSGQSQRTCIPPSLHYITPRSTNEDAINEAQTVLFPVFEDLLSKTQLSPLDIDIIIVNRSGFCSTPSLSPSLSTRKDRSMMVLNCLFRSGSAAILISNKASTKRVSKYRLLYALRTQGAFDDVAYKSTTREEDDKGIIGVTLKKDVLHKKFLNNSRELYIPNFRKVVQHYCLPSSGKTVITEIGKKMKLKEDEVELALMTLHRFGNQSSSLLWVDYEETFSPVADIRAMRILIAIVVYYDYEIWQIDVKTTFFNGHLSEEVYKEQPEGFDVKSYLGRSFAMKHLGKAAYILGIKIYRNRSKWLIGLCQKAYIEKILKRYYMENSKCETIPMQEKLKLSKSQGASTPAEKQCMQNIPYASANLGEEHWTAVKNILKHLHNTKDIFLVYGGNMERQLRVSCYTDAGYLTNSDNLKSQTGFVFVLNKGDVNWKRTKQKPISMYCDNTEAIAIAKDDGVTKGARYFRAKVHYLCETIKLGDIKIEKIDTDDNLADPFTKALAFSKHFELTRNIGLLPASSFM
nr:3-ketoacyl-CoA synthase 5-like [Tanacetum cinerariifolium]